MSSSFKRVKPKCWAGAFTCWGRDNKEAPLRLVNPPGGASAANFEYKLLDATANVHIALAALTCAGLAGLKAAKKLPPPVNEDPVGLPEADAKALGVQRLPTTMEQALAATHADKGAGVDAERCERSAALAVLKEALEEGVGAPLLTAYLAVKKAEMQHYTQSSTVSQRNTVTPVGIPKPTPPPPEEKEDPLELFLKY